MTTATIDAPKTAADSLTTADARLGIEHQTPDTPAVTHQTDSPELLPYTGRVFDFRVSEFTGCLQALDAEVRGLTYANCPTAYAKRTQFNHTLTTLKDWRATPDAHTDAIKRRYCSPESLKPVRKAAPPAGPSPTAKLIDQLEQELTAQAARVDDDRRRFIVAMVDDPGSYNPAEHSAFLHLHGLSVNHVRKDIAIYQGYKKLATKREQLAEMQAEQAKLKPVLREKRISMEAAGGRCKELMPDGATVKTVAYREAQHKWNLATDSYEAIATQMREIENRINALTTEINSAIASHDPNSRLPESQAFVCAGLDGDESTPTRLRECRELPRNFTI